MKSNGAATENCDEVAAQAVASNSTLNLDKKLAVAADGLNVTSPLLDQVVENRRPCDEVHQRLFPTTTTPSSANNASVPHMRKNVILNVGAYIPQCNKTTGQFSAQQCHGSTGYCWCAHPHTNARLTEKRRPWVKTEGVEAENCDEVAAHAVASNSTLNLDDKETTDMKNFAVESQENILVT